MASEPPPFQEASRCDVCKSSFNTFRRRHHCRCCGRTLCYEHSSNQMALPQFGIYSSVRVCADCFNNSFSRSVKAGPTSSAGVNSVTDSVSKLVIKEQENLDPVPVASHEHPTSVLECKCGMPLCICEAPAPPVDAQPIQKTTISTITAQPPTNPKLKKINTAPKNRASTSNSRLNSFFNFGQVNDGNTDKTHIEYEVDGEGLREAIKNGDIAAVKKLLSEVLTVKMLNYLRSPVIRTPLHYVQGVDSNYCDKQGLSLLHLAAVFNQTDIVFMLIDHGANLDYKNAQGETPLDCAPAMLQYKMRMKMESQHQDPSDAA